jgi:hypothetical protein
MEFGKAIVKQGDSGEAAGVGRVAAEPLGQRRELGVGQRSIQVAMDPRFGVVIHGR